MRERVASHAPLRDARMAAVVATSSSNPHSERLAELDTPAPDHAVLLAETLGLSCLYERAGDQFIRLPVHFRQQEPGCEWHGQRAGGRLVRLTFTCERLEDWASLAEKAPDAVVSLYRDVLARPEVSPDDLFWKSDVFCRDAPGSDDFSVMFRAGSYNPLNPWNTVRGAVHLTSRNRPADHAGEADSRIGAQCPAGLRLADLRLLRSDGTDLTSEIVRVTRRDPESHSILRLEVAPPSRADYGIDELKLPGGQPLTALGIARILAPPPACPAPPSSGRQETASSRDRSRPWAERAEQAVAWPDAGAGRTMPGALVAAAMSRPTRPRSFWG